jgi:hypothetical protein
VKADPQLLAARARAEAARAQLMASVQDARTRLDPRTLAEHAVATAKAKAGHLAEDAVATARAKASDLAEDGVEVVRDRPAVAALAATGAALLLARRPIGRWIGRWWAGDDETPPDDTSSDNRS